MTLFDVIDLDKIWTVNFMWQNKFFEPWAKLAVTLFWKLWKNQNFKNKKKTKKTKIIELRNLIFFILLVVTIMGRVLNLERRNVERPVFRNFKTVSIKIIKDELFDNFIFEFIFSLFINYLHNLIIFQMVKYWFCKW